VTIQHLGVRTPSDRSKFYDEDSYSEHEDLSGMEYQVFEHRGEDEMECLIGTSHDAVGLVTWWRADGVDEATDWVEQQAKDARDAAADESYSEVLAVFAGHKEEIADAVLDGLARLGAVGGDWDSGAIETLLAPIVDLLTAYQIPSVGSSSGDAIAFWEGVAIRHGVA
jgi:hypothetical protein